MENRAFISLRISGQELNLREITKQLHMSPTHAYKKGESFLDRWRGGEKIVYREDCWLAETETEPGETPELALTRFVVELLPFTDFLKRLSQSADITILVSVYPESEQVNLHLSPEVIAALYQIGAGFDGSVLFLRQFYDGRA